MIGLVECEKNKIIICKNYRDKEMDNGILLICKWEYKVGKRYLKLRKYIILSKLWLFE